jgi:sucrose-6-phosphate hydrolase SacC (GH32 family)
MMRRVSILLAGLTLGLFAGGIGTAAAAEDILLADFEGTTYGAWEVKGDAFGTGPAHGTLPGQQPVSGFLGKGLVNTFRGGDRSTGTLTSPLFKVERRYINFLLGGGHHPGQTCVNLLLDGKIVRTDTGNATTGADDEHLSWHTWDVDDLKGKSVRIQIVDAHTGGWGHINVDHIYQSDRRKLPLQANETLTRAQASLEGAAGRAQADPLRPIFHVLPVALWSNDPNGPLFYKGHYHLFYQLNPYGDRWEHMHWGHVRSKDLVHWEHLPIALGPSRDRGEEHVFSGCAVVPRKGRPLLLYTSIGNRAPEQWGAIAADDDLIRWKKHPANPLLIEKLHGDVKVHEWRDPFVFTHEGRTYLVAGGNLNGSKGGQAVVNIYRAENEELTRWHYLGVLFRHPDAGVRNIECPNFFQLGDNSKSEAGVPRLPRTSGRRDTPVSPERKWVLIVSQGQPVQYFVGRLNAKTMRFEAETRGVVDHGNFYAPNSMEDGKGRRLLWGWVNGFRNGRGWNGCMTLPRVLTLGPDGLLRQRPAPELEKLRGKAVKIDSLRLDGSARVRDAVKGDTLEIVADLERGTARSVGLRVRRAADGSRAVTIAWDGRELEVAGMKAPMRLPEGAKRLRLHIFLDRSVIEVYAGDRVCLTRVVYPKSKDVGVEVFATGGTATVHALTAWPLRSIWD